MDDTSPGPLAPPARPVRLIVTDDLERSRLTVFFRLILAIPLFVIYLLWSLAAFVVVIGAWFVLLVRGQLSDGMHGFLTRYVQYTVRLNAYLYLVANPYPGFGLERGYPVEVEIDPPAPQRRLSVFFRLFLALPAILLAAVTGGGGPRFGWQRGRWRSGGLSGGGTSTATAFLGWFASLARGRMPRGLRDLGAYGIGYSAQTYAYVLLLTDRYPSADPRFAGPMELPAHPVRIEVTDDLERPRLLVLFRILLALPHLVWLLLWTVVTVLAAIVAWLVAIATARVPAALHRFLAAYVRYAAHVGAFISLVGGPFPGFVGRERSYPIDVEIDPPERHRRATVVFRGLLAIPAFIVAGAYEGVAYAVAFLGWWYALVRGEMPLGLRDVGAAAIRYQAQTWAYALLLTPRYPYAAPALEGTPEEPPEQIALELDA